MDQSGYVNIFLPGIAEFRRKVGMFIHSEKQKIRHTERILGAIRKAVFPDNAIPTLRALSIRVRIIQAFKQSSIHKGDDTFHQADKLFRILEIGSIAH